MAPTTRSSAAGAAQADPAAATGVDPHAIAGADPNTTTGADPEFSSSSLTSVPSDHGALPGPPGDISAMLRLFADRLDAIEQRQRGLEIFDQRQQGLEAKVEAIAREIALLPRAVNPAAAGAPAGPAHPDEGKQQPPLQATPYRGAAGPGLVQPGRRAPPVAQKGAPPHLGPQDGEPARDAPVPAIPQPYRVKTATGAPAQRTYLGEGHPLHVPTDEPAPAREVAIRLAAPSWSGDPANLDAFVNACENNFACNPVAFGSEPRQVGWALSHIGGDPGKTLHEMWRLDEAGDFLSWAGFVDLLQRMYGDPDVAGNALVALQALRQTGSVRDYANRFRLLAARANVSDRVVLRSWLLRGFTPAWRRIVVKVAFCDVEAIIAFALSRADTFRRLGIDPDKPDRPTPIQAQPARWAPRAPAPPRAPPAAAASPPDRPASAQKALPATQPPRPGPRPAKEPLHSRLGIAKETFEDRSRRGLCWQCGGEHRHQDCPHLAASQALRVNAVLIDDESGLCLLGPRPDDGAPGDAPLATDELPEDVGYDSGEDEDFRGGPLGPTPM